MKKIKYDNNILKEFIPYDSNLLRIKMMMRSAFKGLKNPDNGEYISELGDLSSMNTLNWIKLKMENDETGRIILYEKPIVNELTINFNELREYDKKTLGYNYWEYMNNNKFSPNERPMTKLIPDLDLAYVCQRYKETHDFYHVLLGYKPSLLHEVSVKWFEGLHLRLPSASLASIFGCLTLSVKDIFTLYNHLLPHAIHNAYNCEFIINTYFEKKLKEDIRQVRKELNIISLDEFKY